MSLTNKLFSLLGFAEPVTLKRFNGTNLLPKKVLLLGTSNQVSGDIHHALTQLNLNVIEHCDDASVTPIEALVIDATRYSDESCYQNLYSTVQQSLKSLSNNARVLLLANAANTKHNAQENAFSQALIGFTKSLAKEVGRKGSTANIILINRENCNTDNNVSIALAAPLKFFLSAKSAFVSGQALIINSQAELESKSSKALSTKKVAVVTGAAQGIGEAIASKLADDNYFVIGVDIEPMKAQLIRTMKNLQGEAFILDVSAKNAGEQLVTLANKHNGFDLMVHNAGITRDKTLAKMPEHFWQQTLDINLFSVMRINEDLINNECINDGGSILCLSSMNGIAGQGGQTNYACSKAGIIGYVKSMSGNLAAKNMTINAVAPGFIETKMTDKMPFFTREMGRRMNALGQGGLPKDVAETVAFLGRKSSFAISGQTIRVCGLNIIGA